MSYTTVEQSIDDNGDIDVEDTNTETGDNGVEATCEECQSGRCVWKDNIEDLREEFESDEEYENFMVKFRQKNQLENNRNANFNNRKTKVDVNSRLGEGE